MRGERRRICFFGRVQGVGFRATCSSLAREFAVSGLVRNLYDGSVELVCEGDPAEIDRFLGAIESEMGPRIERIEVESEPIAGPSMTKFTISY